MVVDMATAMEVDAAPVADEAWLIWRARRCLKSDPAACKVWLITAKTLFPGNFNIQYEEYSIEVANKNTTAAAKLIEQMLVSFPSEPRLWDEIRALLAALQSDAQDPATRVKKEIFGAIPASLQCHMLSQIAEGTRDILERCRLMTLVLQRYPDRVKLIDSLLSAEKHAHVQNAVNCYRKCMVCDVLPVVLRAPPAELPQKQALRWLQKGIEFYISYITCPPGQESLPSPTGSADLMSPTASKPLGVGAGYKRVRIAGLPERESYILEPWQKLFKLFQQIAVVLDWKVDQIFTTSSRETQWQQIYAMFQTRSQPQGDAMVPHKQILYCTTLLFLDCLYTYSCGIDSEQFAGTTAGTHARKQIVMLEAFASSSNEPARKHARGDSSMPRIGAGSGVVGVKDLTHNFLTALKCWDLLHSAEPLEKDFSKMCQHWKADTWFWLKGFEADVNIYQGDYQEALKFIRLQAAMPRPLSSQLRIEAQLSCCHLHLGQLQAACDSVLNVVTQLQPISAEGGVTSSSAAGAGSAVGDSPGRQLQLVQCSAVELLPYCVQLLLNCFTEVLERGRSDLCLGHTVILSQWAWPRYAALFENTMTRIRQQGSFAYPILFNYLTNIDMLEEFAFIESPEGGSVSLEVLPKSAKLQSLTRTVTRGVDKTAREDFRAALNRQVAICDARPARDVIVEFLSREREAIIFSVA